MTTLPILPDAPKENAEVCLLTDIQRTFAEDETARRQTAGEMSSQWYSLRSVGKDDSVPAPVVFSWHERLTDGVLHIARREDFSDAVTVRIHGTEHAVYNLRIGTRYFWRVTDGVRTSRTRTFTTADMPPRWLYIDGNTNARDIGGWRTLDGCRVRQDLIFRTSEFDTHLTLTPRGIKTLTEELGVRTDLDLRGEVVGLRNASVLSPYGVEWVLLPITPYTGIFDPEYRDNLAACFRVLADVSRYPICFHCWGGADRGGTVALLLNGLLGVGEDDLILDYELTTLSAWGTRTRNNLPFAEMFTALKGCPGKTFAEKCAAFLGTLGVTHETIAALRENLTEDV